MIHWPWIVPAGPWGWQVLVMPGRVLARVDSRLHIGRLSIYWLGAGEVGLADDIRHCRRDKI